MKKYAPWALYYAFLPVSPYCEKNVDDSLPCEAVETLPEYWTA